MTGPARLLASVVASLALCAAAAAEAKDSRTYFVARAKADGAPRQLSDSDAGYYGAVFRAIDQQQWTLAQQLLEERSPGLLHPVATAELYVAANSPRVELSQIQAWFETGSDLPEAAQLGRLALTRGATQLPQIPVEREVYPRGAAPKRVRPASVDDGTMPADLKTSILDRIVNDDPDGARLLLDGIDASLSPEARAEWRQRIAWAYYIENMDRQALAMAQTVSQGRGAWVAEGEWVAGLAAWRLNDCAAAQDGFQRAAFAATNPELRSASLYWGSRAALRCREPDEATKMLTSAAGDDQSLYGMLAAEQLGRTLPSRLAQADLSPEDWRRIGKIDNVRVAVALSQIGRDELASAVLLHQARIGDPADYAALSRLARELCLPQTQLYMAYNAPTGASADPASFYPTPKWAPVDGWRVDPALAYAHTLQESNFRASAVSQADARGLMQITPITVRQHAPSLNLSASQVDIFDPGTNLAFGQQNLEMLRDSPATSGTLPKIMAAYNAGLTPVTRWNDQVHCQDDPLLYMESIPYWETRGYVAVVMRNYWMYERQADADSPSRVALAQNKWPMFPEDDAPASSRVYLTAGAH